MNILTGRNITLAFSITFIGVGVLGFIPNPLVSANGVFEVNTMHNLVHILTGVVFYITKSTEKIARLSLKIVGVVYVAVTILGFLSDDNLLLGLVRLNEPDKWLHLGLAVVILGSGFLLPNLPAKSGMV